MALTLGAQSSARWSKIYRRPFLEAQQRHNRPDLSSYEFFYGPPGNRKLGRSWTFAHARLTRR